MKILLIGSSIITLHNRNFGDSDNIDFRHIIGRITENQPERYVDTDFHGTNTYNFTVPILKCSSIYSNVDQFESWLLANNGKEVTLRLMDGVTIVCEISGFISLTNMVEGKNQYLATLSLAQEY